MATDGLISFGARLGHLAVSDPEGAALIFGRADGPDRVVSWSELDRWSTRLAHVLTLRGVTAGSTVVIAIPNSPEHIACAFATWKAGGCTLPVSYAMPDAEFDKILRVASPAVVIADGRGDLPTADVADPPADDTPLPSVIAQPGKAIGSGGSTGTPKIIVDPNPWGAVPGMFTSFLEQTSGMRPHHVVMLAGPLYHNLPFTVTSLALFEGHTVVLMDRFDAARCVDLIERHRVGWIGLVPTMMQRIARLDGIAERDLSSVEGVFHTASKCPEWVKRAWIDLVGAQSVYEAFAATEGIGHATIRGDEWLEHPGSVGKPSAPVRIIRDDGTDAGTGEVGLIHFEAPENATYDYVGAERAATTPDGYVTLGDMGWLDDEGYVYIADRRVDLIVTGGANVYPAEVEAVLTQHPRVADAVVLGLPDAEWGRRVHAVIEPAGSAGADGLTDELDAHCRAQLTAYKVPKSYEFVDAIPRNEAGKVRRTAMVEQRMEETRT